MRNKFLQIWLEAAIMTALFIALCSAIYDFSTMSMGQMLLIAACVFGIAVGLPLGRTLDLRRAEATRRRRSNETRSARARENADQRWKDEQQRLQFLASQNGVDNMGHTIIVGEVVKD